MRSWNIILRHDPATRGEKVGLTPLRGEPNPSQEILHCVSNLALRGGASDTLASPQAGYGVVHLR